MTGSSSDYAAARARVRPPVAPQPKLNPSAARGAGLRSSKSVLLVVSLATLLVGAGCPKATKNTANRPPVERVGTKHLEMQIEKLCTACHVLPQPADFPKTAWRNQVQQMYEFYFQNPRLSLTLPPMNEVIEYFESRAPQSLPMPPESTGIDPGGLHLVKAAAAEDDSQPAVSHLGWLTLEGHTAPSLLACDMRTGNVRAYNVTREGVEIATLAQLQHPSGVQLCDLDGDGRSELVAGDLGSFLPADHARGRVVWLRGEGTGPYEPVVLASNIGRVADVQPADFDGDGDQDLIVAEFGWRTTGRILLLLNLGMADGKPHMHMRVIDDRHGAIHVPVHDINGDGRPDFLALIAQEHETVEWFINQGDATFRPERIFAADRPSFGSCGVTLVDLDGDGDQDILLSNGDAFDFSFLRVEHALRWLENDNGQWHPHVLAHMPGVQKAVAADLDGDGDLDLVAGSFLPEQLLRSPDGPTLSSLIWLEQTAPRQFTQHVLEVDDCTHSALMAADFDDDSRVDLAFGGFVTKMTQRLPAVTILWNEPMASEQSEGDTEEPISTVPMQASAAAAENETGPHGAEHDE